MVIQLDNPRDPTRPFTLLEWGHWFTFANLLFALLLSFFYINIEPAPSTLTGWLYLLTTWVGHFAFLSLACFILTIFPVVTLFPYKRHIRGVSAVMASLFQTYLFLDVLAYRGLGYHLTTSSVDQLSEVEDVYLANLGSGYWFMLLAVFIAILSYQFLVSNLTWKRIHQLQAFRFKNHLASVLFACFVTSHGMHIWADATVQTDIARQSSLFPGSYPLTAKTLLARHGLIDLQEYQQSISRQTYVNNQTFMVKAPTIAQCEAEQKPNLKVYLLPQSAFMLTRDFLQTNNIKFQENRQLNLANDLDTNLFNLRTGLPGLYQLAQNREQLNLNQMLNDEKIHIEIHQQAPKQNEPIAALSDKRVYIFFQEDADQEFYRSHALFVGFDEVKDLPIATPNIIASYLADTLGCEEFVAQNLIDKPLGQMDSDEILTNYNNGYFHLVFKDKAMLFNQGRLISNHTFSTNKEVSERLDLYTVQRAIKKITGKRINTTPTQ